MTCGKRTKRSRDETDANTTQLIEKSDENPSKKHEKSSNESQTTENVKRRMEFRKKTQIKGNYKGKSNQDKIKKKKKPFIPSNNDKSKLKPKKK